MEINKGVVIIIVKFREILLTCYSLLPSDRHLDFLFDLVWSAQLQDEQVLHLLAVGRS